MTMDENGVFYDITPSLDVRRFFAERKAFLAAARGAPWWPWQTPFGQA